MWEAERFDNYLPGAPPLSHDANPAGTLVFNASKADSPIKGRHGHFPTSCLETRRPGFDFLHPR